MQPQHVPPGIDVEKLLESETELKARIDDLKAQLGVIRQVKIALGLTRQSSAKRPAAPAHRSRRSGRGEGGTTWLDDITRILRDKGAPMHWEELYEGMRQLRPGLESKGPAAVIRSYVRRANNDGDHTVVPAGKGQFKLSEWGDVSDPPGSAGEIQEPLVGGL